MRSFERDIPVTILRHRCDEASLAADQLTGSINPAVQHTRPDQRVDVFDSQLVE